MYKKVLFVLCAMLVVSGAAQATDVWYKAGSSNSWADANNWYVDYACTTGLGHAPTSAETVYATTMAADYVGVTTHDYRDTAVPGSTNDFWITLTGGPYTSWTQQVVNITENAACDQMRLGAYTDLGSDAARLTRLQKIELNVTNNSTLTCSGDYVPGRRNYSEIIVNIEAGSTIHSLDEYNDPDGWRAITNVSGSLIIDGRVDCRSSCGWSFPDMYDFLGDIYYDFGTYDNAGATEHLPVGGTRYPYQDTANMVVIEDGGLFRANYLNSPGTQIAPDFDVVLNSTGALMQLVGDQLTTVMGYKGNGIIFNGVVGDDMSWTADYDGTYTNIYIPEPSTMVLLGLGAVGLIRRKK